CPAVSLRLTNAFPATPPETEKSPCGLDVPMPTWPLSKIRELAKVVPPPVNFAMKLGDPDPPIKPPVPTQFPVSRQIVPEVSGNVYVLPLVNVARVITPVVPDPKVS